MKYSESLRIAIPKITPYRGGNYYNEKNPKPTEACVTEAISVFSPKVKNINELIGAMREIIIEEKDFPTSKEELFAGFVTMIHKNEQSQGEKYKGDLIAVRTQYRLHVILFTLNDGLEWEWPRIADWLESKGY